MVRRKRFPTIRVTRLNPSKIFESAREARHGIHAVHQIEHLLEHRQPNLQRLARATEKLRMAGERQYGEARRLGLLRQGLVMAGTGASERARARGRALLSAALVRGAGAGGPLVVTIGVTVNIEDMEDVPDEALEGLESDIHEIMANTAMNTVAEAKSLAPVKTGALRDSITGTVDDIALMVTFIANTSYAIYQEDGTSHNPPSPYLREPAAEAEENMNSQIENAIAANLDGQVQGDPSVNVPTVDLELETELEVVE